MTMLAPQSHLSKRVFVTQMGAMKHLVIVTITNCMNYEHIFTLSHIPKYVNSYTLISSYSGIIDRTNIMDRTKSSCNHQQPIRYCLLLLYCRCIRSRFCSMLAFGDWHLY